jgi:hypothetical protein
MAFTAPFALSAVDLRALRRTSPSVAFPVFPRPTRLRHCRLKSRKFVRARGGEVTIRPVLERGRAVKILMKTQKTALLFTGRPQRRAGI